MASVSSHHESKMVRRGSFAVAIATAILLSVGIATSSGAAPPRTAASQSISPSQIASKWIAALGPASQQFPKIVAELKSLPITATDAQIASIVAPVAGLMKPIEALASPTSPQPPTTSNATSLEALGAPSHGICTGYRSAEEGADLTMAGDTYSEGFQLHVPNTVFIGNPDAECFGPLELTWHVGSLYHAFTALIGVDSTNATPAILSFVGPNGSPLKFSADGQPVTSVTLEAGVPTRVGVNITGDSNFIIRVSPQRSGGGAIVDFANDSLTA